MLKREICGGAIMAPPTPPAQSMLGPASLQLLVADAEPIRAAAERWLVRNLNDKGLFAYSLNPYTGEISAKNNELRQLMAARLLAELSSSHTSHRPLHRRNLRFIMKHWYREENGLGFIQFQKKSKLGGNAMLLRVLLASPFFDKYLPQARATAEGLLKLQQADGSFRAWLIEPDYPFDEKYLLTFYSGEALVALLECHQRTRDARYLERALASAEFYLKAYVGKLDENYYPAYVPWHTIAYNGLHKITGEDRFREAIFVLNDKLLELQNTSKHVGRFFNPRMEGYGMPHASSDGVYTEGIAHAFEVALRVGDEAKAARYLHAIGLAVRNLASLQYRSKIEGSPLPFHAYRGAIRTNAGRNPWIRVDNTQHTIDAIRHMELVLAGAGREKPRGWPRGFASGQ
jgi:hypothetical protein